MSSDFCILLLYGNGISIIETTQLSVPPFTPAKHCKECNIIRLMPSDGYVV